jgi:hypothetical protein
MTGIHECAMHLLNTCCHYTVIVGQQYVQRRSVALIVSNRYVAKQDTEACK